MVRINSKAGNINTKFVYYMVFLITFSFFLPLFVGSLRSHTQDVFPMPEKLELSLFYELIINNCFAYADENQITHSNILDLNKITEENLKTCFLRDNEKKTYESLSVEIIVPELAKRVYLSTTTSKLSKQLYEPCAIRLDSGIIVPCTIKVKT